MKKKTTYQEAAAELEHIMQALEQGDLNIDQLSDKIKTATKLLAQCKNALHTIEDEVNGLLEADET